LINDKGFFNSEVLKQKEDLIFTSKGNVVAAKLTAKNLNAITSHLDDALNFDSLSNVKSIEVDVLLAEYIWDLLRFNKDEIENDFAVLYDEKKKSGEEKIKGKVYNGVHLLSPDNIIIEEGAIIKPGCVIDASAGPVIIDKNVYLYPNVVIEGPVYIGEDSKIKAGAFIYDAVSIGKVCKIGGEVEASIIMPYSNKQHAGFLGHAYLGSWCNLGADTNNSDLKNNYSNVKINLNGREIDSGMQFLGLIMGDHSKTAINTMFNTGTVVGFFCNIFDSGFPPKNIPSFSWGGSQSITTYDLNKSIEVAKKVYERRSKEFSIEEEKLFAVIFNQTVDSGKHNRLNK
jgi:UDP-N-acetylglucosamine diphosphorylase/glucosamine-1-phosphate N-acetyltransferase